MSLLRAKFLERKGILPGIQQKRTQSKSNKRLTPLPLDDAPPRPATTTPNVSQHVSKDRRDTVAPIPVVEETPQQQQMSLSSTSIPRPSSQQQQKPGRKSSPSPRGRTSSPQKQREVSFLQSPAMTTPLKTAGGGQLSRSPSLRGRPSLSRQGSILLKKGRALTPSEVLQRKLGSEKMNPLLTRMAGNLKKFNLEQEQRRLSKHRESLSTHVPQEVVNKVKRANRLLRAMAHLIGLATFASRRSHNKTSSASSAGASTFVRPYRLNPNLFDVDTFLQVGRKEFHVFRVHIDEIPFTFSLHQDNDMNSTWVLSMMNCDDTQSMEETFRQASVGASETSVAGDDGILTITCSWSSFERCIVPRRIRNLTSDNDEYNIINDFARRARAIDPQNEDYTIGERELPDASTFRVGELPLPTAQDMASLPVELTETIIAIAIRTLRQYFYPRVLLTVQKRHRRRLIDEGMKTAPPVTFDVLMKQNMFRSWTQDLQTEVLQHLRLISCVAGEYIIHEDENAGSGIFFLMQGTVGIYKKMSRVHPDGRKNKSIGPDNTKKLVELSPPMCFGEFAFLTDEPRMATVKASTNVHLWVLNKHDFGHIFARLPKNLLTSVIAVAFEKRNGSMNLSYPMTVEYFRSFPMFRQGSKELLEMLRAKCVPYAVPKNFTLVRAGERATHMYFLRNGKVAVYQQIEEGEAEVHCKNMHQGLIGDEAVLFNSKNNLTFTTVTNCDLWALSKVDFDATMLANQTQLQAMYAETQDARQVKLSSQTMRFKDFLDEIPILKHFISAFAYRDFYPLWEARVYKPHTLITATAHYCDRLILLTKGRIRIGDGDIFHSGECIGFTCVVPHRWAVCSMTLDIVEVLELNIEKYIAFLKKHNIFKQVSDVVRTLMFPRAFPEDAVHNAWGMVSHLLTPVMFPMSLSTKVNLHEHGFGVLSVEEGAVCANTRNQIPPAPVIHTMTSAARLKINTPNPNKYEVFKEQLERVLVRERKERLRRIDAGLPVDEDLPPSPQADKMASSQVLGGVPSPTSSLAVTKKVTSPRSGGAQIKKTNRKQLASIVLPKKDGTSSMTLQTTNGATIASAGSLMNLLRTRSGRAMRVSGNIRANSSGAFVRPKSRTAPS